MYGHIRCIYTVLANPNNIWLGGTGVCCTHVQFPGTVLALSWWHRCFCCTVLAQCVSWHSPGTVLVAQVFLLHSPGTVCFLAQFWHCLGGTGVCCTHAAISCCNQQWVCMHTFTCILWRKTSLASWTRSSVFGAATTSSRKQKKREHSHIEGLQAQASSTTPACKKLNASLVLRCR